MGEHQDIRSSLLSLFAKLSFSGCLGLLGRRSYIDDPLEELETAHATLYHNLNVAPLLIRRFIVISYPLPLLFIAKAFLNTRDVGVTNKDPGNFAAGRCCGRQALQKVINRLCELPCIWHTSVWVMELRGIPGQDCPRFRASWVYLLLMKPFINIKVINAVLKAAGCAGIACFLSARVHLRCTEEKKTGLLYRKSRIRQNP